MKVPDLASSCSRSGFWAGCGHNGASSPCWGTSNGATFPLILFHPHSTRDSPVLPFRTLSIRSLIIFSAFPRGKQPAESGDFKNLMLFSSAFPFCQRCYVPNGSSGWARVSRPNTQAGVALVENVAHRQTQRFTPRAARQHPNELL